MRDIALSSLLLVTMAVGQAVVGGVGAPVDDSGQTNASASIFIPVLMNDPRGSELVSVSSARAAIQDGQLFYTPGGFTGNDTFTYETQSGTATVTVAVTAAPPVPTGDGEPVNDFVTTPEGQSILIRVLDNDPVGSLLYGINNPPQELPSILRGTVTMVGNQIRYTPPENYTGTDSFTYQTQGGTARVNVGVVDSVSEAPETAVVLLRNESNTPVRFRLTTSPGVFLDIDDPTQVSGFENVPRLDSTSTEPFTEVAVLVEISPLGFDTVGFEAEEIGVSNPRTASINANVSSSQDTAITFYIDDVTNPLNPRAALNVSYP